MRGWVVGVLLVGLVASPVAAQEDGAGAGYRAVVERALVEFSAGRWAEARALFRRAHALEPNARALRGIGMASFEMREYPEAIRAFEAALNDPRQPLDEAQRAHVVELLRQAEGFVAIYTIELSPPEARLTVDDLPATLAGDRLVLAIGRHQLRAEADGFEPSDRRLRVVGGERGALSITLEPEPPAIAAAPARPTPRDDTAAHALLAVAGGATLGLGVGLGYTLDRQSAADQCAARPCTNAGAVSAERDVGLAVTVGLGSLALAAGITALVLLLRGDSPGPDARAALTW